MIDTAYFKKYRELLGFNNQNTVKAFLGAKDITPIVDYNYIKLLNSRLFEIIEKINSVLHEDLKYNNLDDFKLKNIDAVFETLKENGIIPKLNNQGRRPEDVYFSWMRGFLISSYFLKAIGFIFDIKTEDIKIIGDDDFRNLETFKRTPKADLEIELKGKKLRIEVQSGFKGINDIKRHKVLEAKKNKTLGINSIVIHFDFFNGQVAFVKIDDIEDDTIDWKTRKQMEGQTVFNINQKYFVWNLRNLPPKASELPLL